MNKFRMHDVVVEEEPSSSVALHDQMEKEYLEEMLEDADVQIPFCVFLSDITEEKMEDFVYELHVYKESCKALKQHNEEEVLMPLQILISSYGGALYPTLAAFDSIKTLQKHVEVETIGSGMVMSAAVLLLAAGSPGHRKIGENCRVMIHSLSTIANGVVDLETENKEMKELEKLYIRLLSENSRLSEKDIKKMLKKKENCYFSAHEAVAMGIADEII